MEAMEKMQGPWPECTREENHHHQTIISQSHFLLHTHHSRLWCHHQNAKEGYNQDRRNFVNDFRTENCCKGPEAFVFSSFQMPAWAHSESRNECPFGSVGPLERWPTRRHYARHLFKIANRDRQVQSRVQLWMSPQQPTELLKGGSKKRVGWVKNPRILHIHTRSYQVHPSCYLYFVMIGILLFPRGYKYCVNAFRPVKGDRLRYSHKIDLSSKSL